MRFYLVAMIFIVFDIEIIFLYPWVVVHRELGAFGLVLIAIFAALGLRVVPVPAVQGGARLGSLRRVRSAGPQPSDDQTTAMVGAHRTSSSTVRRVGLDRIG